MHKSHNNSSTSIFRIIHLFAKKMICIEACSAVFPRSIAVIDTSHELQTDQHWGEVWCTKAITHISIYYKLLSFSASELMPHKIIFSFITPAFRH